MIKTRAAINILAVRENRRCKLALQCILYTNYLIRSINECHNSFSVMKLNVVESYQLQ